MTHRPSFPPASFTAIVPTYNRTTSLVESVRSILDQDLPPEEVIVVDDGSDNDVVALLAEFADRISIIRQTNAGASSARNTGARAATGNWLVFLDSDDIWLPGRMRALRRDLQHADADTQAHLADVRYVGASYSTRLLADIKQMTFPTETAAMVERPIQLVLSGMTLQGAAIRASAWAQCGGLDETMPMYEDTALFCQLALNGKFLVTGQEVATIQRLDDDPIALTGLEKKDPIKACQLRLGYIEQVASADLPLQDRKVVKARLSGAQYQLARRQLKENPVQARVLLIRSALSHTSIIKGWGKALSAFFLGEFGFHLMSRTPSHIDRS